jgi:uncharacterized protein YraI
MKSTSYVGTVIVAAFIACTGWFPAGWAAAPQSDSVGPIAGTVITIGEETGVTVRSEPSSQGRAVGFVKRGTKVENYVQFKNGWVKIRSPFQGAWIPVSSIQPQGAPGEVTAVDRPDNCLRVREGPGSNYEITGCVNFGQDLNLTGYWSDNNWAYIDSPVAGWVYANQIRTSLDPYQPRRTHSNQTYVRNDSDDVYEPFEYDPFFWDSTDGPYDGYSYGTAYPWYTYGKRRFWRNFKRNRHGRVWRGNPVRGGVRVGVGPGGVRVGVGNRRGGVRVGVGRGGVSVGAGGFRGGFGGRGRGRR